MNLHLEMLSLLLSFVGAVLGGVVATIIGERLRMRHERMRAHLAQVKDCLRDVKRQLERGFIEIGVLKLGESFILERGYEPNYGFWRVFHLSCSNRAIYDDLKNHYPELYDRLRVIKQDIAKNLILEYLSSLAELKNAIYNQLEETDLFKVKVKRTEKVTAIAVPDKNVEKSFVTAVLNILLEVDEGSWPNIMNKIRNYSDELFTELYRFAEEVQKRNRHLINTLRSMRENILKYINMTINQIDEKLSLEKLPNRCNFV